MSPWVVACLAGLAMVIGDSFGALYVIELDRGHPAVAGAMDGLTDLTQLVSIGIGAVNIWHSGIPVALLTCVLLFAGSVAGAAIGDRVSRRGGRPPVKTGDTPFSSRAGVDGPGAPTTPKGPRP